MKCPKFQEEYPRPLIKKLFKTISENRKGVYKPDVYKSDIEQAIEQLKG